MLIIDCLLKDLDEWGQYISVDCGNLGKFPAEASSSLEEKSLTHITC